MQHAFVGIHETPAENELGILEHGFTIHHDPNKYKWLGRGVYFWDNDIQLGHWWATQMGHGPYVIFTAQISVDARYFLDLVPRDAREKLQRSAYMLAAKLRKPAGWFDGRLGTIIDMYCEYYRDSGRIDLVRGVFPGLKGEIVFSNCESPINVKIILSARNTTCITEPSVVFSNRERQG